MPTGCPSPAWQELLLLRNSISPASCADVTNLPAAFVGNARPADAYVLMHPVNAVAIGNRSPLLRV